VSYKDWATCTDLFSDVTNITHETFDSALRKVRIVGNTRLEVEEDLFQRWNITSLTSLHVTRNNVTNIWQRVFHSLADLEELDLSGNGITTLYSKTFYYNTGLVRLSLAQNSITAVHRSTFQNNVKLSVIDM
jgi:Leucine-rich repeat (LRR) protein